MRSPVLTLWLSIACAAGWASFAEKAQAAEKDAQTGGSPSADKPSTDTSWSEGLKRGVNGPVPVIVVDQFGYPAKSSKIAVIRNPQLGYDKDASFAPGQQYQVVDRSTGKAVKSGAPAVWNNGATDTFSGDQVWLFDFSDVEAPGTYVIVDSEHNQRSPEFDIDDHVYRRVLKHATRMFFYQRAGFEKTEKTAGKPWADKASHLGPGQDPFARSWIAKDDASQEKDLRGGWFDAGDYNKYTNWAARNMISLLRAFDQNAGAFGDDFGIPESGNGIPDILDEVKWGLDWLRRMQNANGSLLCVQSLAEGSPPSAARGPSFYGPPTTSATLMGAAVFAYASKVYSARPEPELKAYAADLAKRAKAAWAWAAENPTVLYYNNDDGKQPGSQGLAAGQQEMDDAHRLAARFEAAVYLFEITSDPQFREFVDANFAAVVPDWGPSQWDAVGQEALLYYARLPGASDAVRTAISAKFIARMTQNADQLPMIIGKKDPYQAPMKDFTWGSNFSKAAQARLYELLALYAPDPAVAARAKSAALGYLNYLHGVNPLGLVYLTNMKLAGAENSATTMYHVWFAYNSRRWSKVTPFEPGPAPGFLVGGPNPAYSLDSCCFAPSGTPNFKCYMSPSFSLCRRGFSPPLSQPPAKSYLQFNDPWPANSWEVTEPSTGYQAAYILALAPYVN